MKFINSIRDAEGDPQKMEALYQAALQENAAVEFDADLIYCYKANRDDLLLAAWYYRLQAIPPAKVEPARQPALWMLAIPLAILNGLAFWILSGKQFVFSPGNFPHLRLLWAPVAALVILVYLTLTSEENPGRALWIGAALAAIVVYTFLMVGLIDDRFREHYLILGLLHLTLLSWVGVGIYVLGVKSLPTQRFAFLMRSLEVFITGGVYVVVGGIFTMITLQMFQALSIDLDEVFIRLIFAGGGGLIPLLAVAGIYDPHRTPLDQDFKQGLSRFTTTMMRLLLPLTLVVLVIYLFVIPFNFLEPYNNRDVLIIYNVMLFAVMFLLIGATPVFPEDVSPKMTRWLMSGILAVAALTALINLYALSAILYRTFSAELTINRLTVIGWNVINIAILIAMIVRILRGKLEDWVDRIKPVFSRGAVAYLVWGMIVLVVIPLFFR
jgi:hypothetical protein